jgi:hypothetical protein
MGTKRKTIDDHIRYHGGGLVEALALGNGVAVEAMLRWGPGDWLDALAQIPHPLRGDDRVIAARWEVVEAALAALDRAEVYQARERDPDVAEVVRRGIGRVMPRLMRWVERCGDVSASPTSQS